MVWQSDKSVKNISSRTLVQSLMPDVLSEEVEKEK